MKTRKNQHNADGALQQITSNNYTLMLKAAGHQEYVGLAVFFGKELPLKYRITGTVCCEAIFVLVDVKNNIETQSNDAFHLGTMGLKKSFWE